MVALNEEEEEETGRSYDHMAKKEVHIYHPFVIIFMTI
jgi:hypothetical protein